MSAFDLFYSGLLIAGVAAVIVAVWLWKNEPTSAGELPTDWGETADDRRWDDEAADALHTQSAEVRTAATAWGAAISSLLGVFALVAFIKGPESFTDVKGVEADAAALLILLAAFVAATSVLLAALAAQGIPRRLAIIDGWELRHQTAIRAASASRQLAWSRILGVGAALLVVASIGLTWLAALRDTDRAESQTVVVITGAGVMQCGTITEQPGGLGLRVFGGRVLRISNARQVLKVDSCP